MAAPSNVTTKAMSGKFSMNKALSDNTDDILRLQGVSKLTRLAISQFNLTAYIKHTVDEASIEHIDIDQKLSGGIPGATENRVLDGQEREVDDAIFGHLLDKTRRIRVEEVTDEFLKKGWTQDTIDDGIILTESCTAPGKNKCTWRATQTWGFAMANGERRYVRHTTFTSPDKQDGPIHVRLVYDYLGEV